MKKLMFGLALLLSAGMTMAQTPEEKAAMKEAKAQLTQAMKLRDAAKTALQAATAAKPADEAMVKQNCQEADELIEKALAGGHIDQKKLFDAYFVKDEVNTFLLNQEFAKYQRKEDVDVAFFNESLTKACDGMNGVLKYGNPKDDIQAGVIKAEKVKLAKCQVYYALLVQISNQNGNTEAVIDNCKKYIDYPKAYPAVADLCANPNPPYSQMAYYICAMAYNLKDWKTLAEYTPLAKEFDDPDAKKFMDAASTNALLQQGDTIGWVKAMREQIAKDPTSEESEVPSTPRTPWSWASSATRCWLRLPTARWPTTARATASSPSPSMPRLWNTTRSRWRPIPTIWTATSSAASACLTSPTPTTRPSPASATSRRPRPTPMCRRT